MAYLHLPSRRTRQPQGAARLNAASPLASGLVAAWTLNSAYDVVGGRSISRNGGVVVQSRDNLGVGYNATTGDNIEIAPTDTGFLPTGPCTIVIAHTHTSAAAGNPIICCGDALGGTSAFNLFAPYSDGNLYWRYGEHTSSAFAAYTPADNDVIALTAGDAAGRAFWKNGVRVASDSVNNSRTARGSPVDFGNATSASAHNIWKGFGLWIYARRLSDAELSEITRNPWQIFAPDPRRLYFGVSGGATAYTLDAQPGGYTVSGTAATLARGIVLDAQPAAYTLTGTAATLVRGYNLDAQPGSYTVTGAAATLARGYVVDAAPGSFALTGAAATLEYTVPGVYTLDAQPGAYTLTGVAATLTYTPLNAYTLDAQPGTYTLTGAAATLTYAGASIWTDVGVSSVTWSDVGGATSIWSDL